MGYAQRAAAPARRRRLEGALPNSTRWLVALGAIVGALIVTSTIVALVAGDEQTFEEGTPERAVQQYLRAVADGDTPAALALLTPEAQQRCRDTRGGAILPPDERELRATLERTEQRDSTVVVRVRLTERYGDAPFGGGESTQTLLFELKQVDGAWRIAEPAWPLYCADRFPPLPPASAPAVPPATATPPGTAVPAR